MKVSEIMTRNVETCSPDTPLQEVARRMTELDVGSIPVTENGVLRGIITDRDIITRGIAAQFSLDTPVDQILSSDMVTGTPDMDVQEAAKRMSDTQVRRLPIVQGDEVVGIVALGDIAVDAPSAEKQAEVIEDVSKPAEPNR
ncbi:CBS domain-containing protein [Planococcus lenghuensis]|uniref:CBS domain-containing protein n=1 Tax=Planococcus lenghuensis TaxID=2213202 RepID=A0A1Q2L0Y7_9BACL|nr:CBS domain-containing protein [Planococcus lenghuensis]AQQ54099.1 CBS domain-containing protein [Planococcus lenghuensis]